VETQASVFLKGKNMPSRNEDNSYPKDLKQATRAEYVTMVRQANKDKKKSGCPLALIVLVLWFSFISGRWKK
jgi:hypothetical protein